MMKPARRLISGALSLILALSLWTGALPAAYAAPAAQEGQTQTLTGSIGLTIRFDLPQTAASAAGREIALQVSGPGGTAVVSLPDGTLKSNSLGARAAVLVKNEDGVELTSETRVGYYEAELSGLPAGGARYTLTLTGTGYKTYSTGVTLDGYSRHVIVGTGDGTFSLGDIDGNGAVDAGDLTAFEPFLGDGDTAEGFDLNGDGQVDVTDLAYVNHNRGISGESQVLDAAAIVSPSVDTAGLDVTGRTADLFRDEGVVALAPAAGAGGLEIPIELGRPVEMSEIRITCPEGKDLVLGGLEKGLMYRKEDGSVWADLTDAGLDHKLLLRSDGTSVYMTQDIGTAKLRFRDFPIDKMIYVVGNEQNYHFQVLSLLLDRLGFKWGKDLTHFSYGMVELPEGKMKSREGTVVDADDLIDTMIAQASEASASRFEDMDPAEAAEIARMVGLGALKYFLLKVDPRKNMLFNPKESIDFNGNTGPFLQYTYARIRSICRRAAEELQSCSNYCYDLAKEYNQFYHDYPVLREEDAATRCLRLTLSSVVARTLRAAASLLGMEMPERM